MTELEKKLSKALKLHEEIKEAEQTIMLKNGMFGDLMQDIATNHLGYPAGSQKFDLPELLLRVYNRRNDP